MVQKIKKYFYCFSNPINTIQLRLFPQAILQRVENRIISVQIKTETTQNIFSNLAGFCIDYFTQNMVPTASNEQTAIPKNPARFIRSEKLCSFLDTSVAAITQHEYYIIAMRVAIVKMVATLEQDQKKWKLLIMIKGIRIMRDIMNIQYLLSG